MLKNRKEKKLGILKLLTLACLISTCSGKNSIPPLPEVENAPKNFKSPPKDGKCRALALRGGGTKGAYEIGVLKAFVSYIK
jgi:predicted acylesterase/phospholipase RssA